MRVLIARAGSKFGPEYVRAIRRMLEETNPGARLVCLTDSPSGECEERELRRHSGWWSMTEVLAPWNADLRPAVYIDLDTYVMGDLRSIYDLEGLWLIRDFYRPDRSNVGVMRVPLDTEQAWANIPVEPEPSAPPAVPISQAMHGKLQDRVGGIWSYKADRLQECPPESARLVCFHGKPKPHQTEGWARDTWIRYSQP